MKLSIRDVENKLNGIFHSYDEKKQQEIKDATIYPKGSEVVDFEKSFYKHI